MRIAISGLFYEGTSLSSLIRTQRSGGGFFTKLGFFFSVFVGFAEFSGFFGNAVVGFVDWKERR